MMAYYFTRECRRTLTCQWISALYQILLLLLLFLNNRNEMCSALIILTDFGRVSGLELNVKKCEGFWLGRDKTLQGCNLFGIK